MSSRSHAAAFVATLFIGSTFPSIAIAQQPKPEPTFQEKETARKLLDKGRAAEAKGDLTTAIESYRAAHSIMGVATTGIYLAQALSKNGNLIEARDVALQTSREPKLKNERPERTLARNDAAKLVASLGPRIPSLVIDPSPREAINLEVLVDDKPVPAAVYGQPWSVDPGTHTVKVRAQGFEEHSQSIDIKESATAPIKVVLVPLPQVTEAPAPPPPPPPRAPAHEAGMRPAWIVAITGLSVGGAALAAGGVTGTLSLLKTNDIKASCRDNRCPASAASDADSAQLLATVSNVTFAVGGAFALGGLVALTVGLTSGDAEAPAAVSMSVGPSQLLFEGRF